MRDQFTLAPSGRRLARMQCLGLLLLALVPGLPASATASAILSEFMALNQSTLADDFGNFEDWIEIHNPGPTNINLDGWALTDNAGNLGKWIFPSTNLPSGGYLIVFASDRNRRTPGAVLHTNFKLSGDGEFLGLVRPDGTVATQFAPTYPAQSADVSFGLSYQTTTQIPLTLGSIGRATVPTNGAAEMTWTLKDFNDLPWSVATNGIGFETGVREFAANVAGEVLGDSPAGYWRLNEPSTGDPVVNIGSLGAAGNGQYLNSVTNNLPGPRPPDFGGFESTNTCARFNGSNARVDVPFSTALNPDGAFSIECWVQPVVLGGAQCILASMNPAGAGRRGYALYVSETNQWEFRLGNDDGLAAMAGGGVPQTNVWTHLVGVYDGVNARLFVNGAEVASAPLSSLFEPNTNAPLRFGAFSSSPPQDYFNGFVDEVAVHGNALAAADVALRHDNATTGATNYAGLIQTDLRTAMHGVNSSAYLRLPFVLNTGVTLEQATLRVKHDDGFAAFLNGTLIASANAPASPVWNSAATNRHATKDALAFESHDVAGAIGTLASGTTNVLALQGFNLSATNSDFLLLPELEIVSSGYQPLPRYFVLPTPGAINGAGGQDLGPILTQTGHFPNVPTTNDHLTITCRVTQALSPVGAVTLHSRVMFGSLKSQPMFDDGLNGDGVAGDGIYGATIHRTNYAAGQMVRWYVQATDSLSRTSRWPLFADPLDSAEYLGTVVQTNYVSSKLPVVHLFAPSGVLQPGPNTWQTGADSDNGGRVAVFYDGEFYDNVFMFLRGNTTANYNKKSHRLRFNREHKFRHNESSTRIRNTSFVADYADPTYLRQRLSYWFCSDVGAPGPFYAPYRLQLNGQFYQLANHNDVHSEELLERLGYDPNGALYNAVGTVVNPLDSTGGFDKKTRRWDNNDDYAELAAAISETNSVGRRLTNLLDRLDLPQVISYMVAARIALETDDVEANMSLYHDNDGDDLWRIIPFDMNLSWGASYYENNLAIFTGIHATNDHLTSFPLYGSSQTIPVVGVERWNRMYDAIFSVPQTREMFLRRMRTMLDAHVKPPGTPPAALPLEARINEWFSLIAEEAVRDRNWWGWPPKAGQSNFDPGITPTNGRNQLLTNFLAARRQHLYGKHSVTNIALPIGINRTNNAGIPLPQPTNAVVSIVGWDYNPVSGNQDEEYIVLTNANLFAVDVSGWEFDGGVRHTLQPGTVLPAGGALYLTPSSLAFRNRAIPPHGGMGLFIQGGYNGRLNAWGESLTLTDDVGRLVSSNSFAGAPSLAQQFLRVTEIMYNPAPAPAITNDAQLFEYIELRNISTDVTLDLSNVRFSRGISFNFTGSAVTSLPPGQRVLLVRNTAAFTARHGAGALIAGEFGGALDSSGETLRLDDASGEKILEFAYNNAWYRITDGLGFSLVIVDDLAHWSTWDKKSSWRPSGELGGSPGSLNAPVPAFAPVLVNEVLAHTDLPLVDTIELYNPTPTNVDIGGWFLTDDFYSPKKYRIPPGTIIAPQGYLAFYADSSFGTGGTPFLLSELGESAHVFGGDSQTNLTGYQHGWNFGASPNGVSFGRHVDSQTNTHFVLQSTHTLGASNALPLVGPVVISEIMYHPPDLPNGVNNDLDEYIELQNITALTVPLFCTFTNEPGYGVAAATNTWHLRNAVDYDFPTNILLAAGARLLIVGFDPAADTNQLAAFKLAYNVPANVPIFGPWKGRLDNSGETLELQRPDRPEFTAGGFFTPYVLVEEIAYRDSPPWPAEADSVGNALQRLDNTAFGNDPVNWSATTTSAGRDNVLNTLPTVSISAPVDGSSWPRLPGITITADVDDPDGSVEQVAFKANGAAIVTLNAAPWSYSWTNAAFGPHTVTATVVDNLGGTTISAPITITVTSSPPVVVITSPTNNSIIQLGTPVMLAANASDPDGEVVAVDYYDNGNLIASVPGQPYSVNWIFGTAGNHGVTAIARDDSGGSSIPSSVQVFVQAVASNTTVAVPGDAVWRYFDAGTNPGTNWTALDYNDASWPQGPAELGYGDASEGRPEATLLSYGSNSANKHPAYYFRHKFVAASPEAPDDAVLRIMRDDGAVAYLNGAEIYRFGMPAGTPTYQTLANATVGDADEYTFHPTNVPPALLVPGTNILAVEVHQASPDSSDISFAAELELTSTSFGPAITAHPQSQWKFAGEDVTFSVSSLGSPSLNYLWQRNGTHFATTLANTITLTNLASADAATYSVIVSNNVGTAQSTEATLIVEDGDYDGDGLPDAWEIANGTNPSVADAHLDPDGDGMSNWMEFIANTDPQDPDSVLRLSLVQQSATQVVFLFEGRPGVGYSIQFTDDSPQDWQLLQQVSPQPTNHLVSFTNSVSLPQRRFFRVVTPQIP